jgi:hypothetical protein
MQEGAQNCIKKGENIATKPVVCREINMWKTTT